MPTDLATVVKRLRLSVPILKALRIDKHMRHMILSQILSMNRADKEPVTVP